MLRESISWGALAFNDRGLKDRTKGGLAQEKELKKKAKVALPSAFDLAKRVQFQHHINVITYSIHMMLLSKLLET